MTTLDTAVAGGLIGDGQHAALVGTDGRIRVGARAGSGVETIALLPDSARCTRQYYLPETAVLVTELRCAGGLVEVTDAFTVPAGTDLAVAGHGELLRHVRVLEGSASLRLSLRQSAGVRADWFGGGLRLRAAPMDPALHLLASHPLDRLRTGVDAAGEDLWLLVRWHPRAGRMRHVHPRRLLEDTATAWRRWCTGISYHGPHRDLVRRSALTLRLLPHEQAATVARSAVALRRLGLSADADSALAAVLDAAESHSGYSPQDADAPGDVLDCAYQWAAHGGTIDEPLWTRLSAPVEAARRFPATPAPMQVLALRQIALDRAARLAAETHLPGDPAAWSARAAELTDRILAGGWDDDQECLTDRLGPGGRLDAALLALPARGVVPAGHPRLAATARAVRRRLTAPNGLVSAGVNRPGRTSPGRTLCLADALLAMGEVDAAGELYDKVCAHAGPLGLLPEEIDQDTGAFAGACPHALSHAGLISTGLALAAHCRAPETKPS
ncbi:glycoside hydrolase family 15 protein [Amycolatopsis alkalitolerans]|uniref:Glycoside hydrolase family 15 protein n=1 Tax=Amycolatopsis alkalitolerans TaxID=2547244 RepID=A0A5C4M3U4_9PSEU|nr:hypothetical protein [Amycolatopsis alkalitolerans]TNC25785.1 hypothetical protein FG385_14160 [Amycolatopsis alkalitolerans]